MNKGLGCKDSWGGGGSRYGMIYLEPDGGNGCSDDGESVFGREEP